jgi:hypothetical protein
VRARPGLITAPRRCRRRRPPRVATVRNHPRRRGAHNVWHRS